VGEGRPRPIDFEELTAAMEDQAREFGDYFLNSIGVEPRETR